MGIASFQQQWYVPSIFSQFSLVWEVLNNTFIGRRCDSDHWWLMWLEIVRHLEQSIWTFELEHALEVFSLATCLNWADYDFGRETYLVNNSWYEFPESLLHYLKCKVSRPCKSFSFTSLS